MNILYMWKLLISKFWFKCPLLYNHFHNFFLEEKESSHKSILYQVPKIILNATFLYVK